MGRITHTTGNHQTKVSRLETAGKRPCTDISPSLVFHKRKALSDSPPLHTIGVVERHTPRVRFAWCVRARKTTTYQRTSNAFFYAIEDSTTTDDL